MEFRVLGDLEVRAAGLRVDTGHARQRAVLAVLLIDLGRAVPAGQLIDRVWGDEPPVTVRNVLYGYIARLRAAIARAGDPDVTLSRQAGGYRLEAGRDQVDLWRFRRLAGEAVAASGDDERAGVLLEEALALWRGPALAGMGSAWLDGMRESIELQRRTAVLDLGDIMLRGGRHRGLVTSLAAEAVAYPADERLIGQLMLALYRSGRQAEALQWFEQTRRRLAEEFGADPGLRLRALHQQILRADPSLTALRASRRERAGPVPRQLPADVPAFTGRTAELAELSKLAAPAAITPAAGTSRPARAPAGQIPQVGAVYVIAGAAGVGKSSLAVHWAHQAAARFPDGQLYVNLHDHHHGQPVTAQDALAGFLRALGVPGQDIPARQDERAAQYQALLAGRRMLVVLDNARSAEQVQLLLPGTAACAALVTSRDPLASLAARHGAMRLDLDVLPPDDGRGGYHALSGRAERESRWSGAPRIAWSWQVLRRVTVAGGALAVASSIFYAGFSAGILDHAGHVSAATTSPDGTALRDGVNPLRAGCGSDAVTLASAQVRLPGSVPATIGRWLSSGTVAGYVQLRYSAACHATWARFEPVLTARIPQLRILVWEIRADDTRRVGVHTTVLEAEYTGMLMTGYNCALAGVVITLREGPEAITTTRCVPAPTAGPGPGT